MEYLKLYVTSTPHFWKYGVYFEVIGRCTRWNACSRKRERERERESNLPVCFSKKIPEIYFLPGQPFFSTIIFVIGNKMKRKVAIAFLRFSPGNIATTVSFVASNIQKVLSATYRSISAKVIFASATIGLAFASGADAMQFFHYSHFFNEIINQNKMAKKLIKKLILVLNFQANGIVRRLP